MKVWITKYALSSGIIEADAEISSNFPSMINCAKTGFFADIPFPVFHGDGKDWHRTEADAKARANAMVQAKIKSVKKSLEKLEKLVF